jgi:hypothetical protein
LSGPRFDVIMLGQGTGVHKRAGHLVLVALGGTGSGHGSGNDGQGLANFFQGDVRIALGPAVFEESFVVQFVATFRHFINSENDALVLSQGQFFEWAEDTIFKNGRYSMVHGSFLRS